MSTKVRQYLYTAEDIYGKDALDEGMSRDEIWHAYEADRVKDAELIQQLVDGLQQIADEGHWTPDMHELLNVAAAAGFKHSEP